MSAHKNCIFINNIQLNFIHKSCLGKIKFLKINFIEEKKVK